MTNLFNNAARSLIGVAGALVLGFGVLAATVAPALDTAPRIATLSA